MKVRKMERQFAALCLVMILCMLGTSACAVQALSVGTLKPLSAKPNQRLALRTGPGTKYEEIFSLNASEVRNFSIYVQEKGGTVMWGMIEFDSDYGRYRAYTGMKRMDTRADVPYGNPEGVVCTIGKEDVKPYYGPGTNYVRFDNAIPAYTEITVYHEEAGYVLADYIAPDAKPQQNNKELLQLTRAWIPADQLSGYTPSVNP